MSAIIGAGLSGLIAAHYFPTRTVLERSPEPPPAHAALLRFRTEEISKLTRIPFKKVRVHKGIYAWGEFQEPNINLANLYARKVTGFIRGDRSIWNTDPVDRFIAPPNFIDQLRVNVEARTFYGEDVDLRKARGDISTIPLDATCKQLELEVPGIEFAAADIIVDHWLVPGADAYQTIYYPDGGIPAYRASLTGDLLIVESMAAMAPAEPLNRLLSVCESFGLPDPVYLKTQDQRYGKIIPLAPHARRALLHRITDEFGVYSLGRFATWRNLLLDDLVQDLSRIHNMMNMDDFELQIARKMK